MWLRMSGTDPQLNDLALADGSTQPSRVSAWRSSLERWVGKWVVYALVTFVVWRLGLLVFERMGFGVWPKSLQCRSQWQVFDKDNAFWNGFVRWDSGWYRNIILHGYAFKEKGTSSAAFYPLFPYLSLWLGKVIGSPWVAGLLLSHLGTLVGIGYVAKTGAVLFDKTFGHRAVVLLLVFPSSFFLAAFYTEGIFLGLASASFYFFLMRRYALAGVLGMLAMLTRSTGVVLIGAFVLELGWLIAKKELRFSPSMLWLLLVPAGLVIFMFVLYVQVGDPMAFAKAQAQWGRHARLPWMTLWYTFRRVHWTMAADARNVTNALDFLSIVAWIAIGIYMAVKRFPISLWSFVLVGALLPVTTGMTAGALRYCLALFPAFFGISALCERRPELERFLIFAFGFFLAVCSLHFMRCGWVA